MNQRSRVRGGALILALIVIGIMTVSFSLYMAQTKMGLTWSSLIKRKTNHEFASQTAMNVALSELKDRIENRNCMGFGPENHPMPFVKTMSDNTVIDQAVVVQDDSTFRSRFWFEVEPPVNPTPPAAENLDGWSGVFCNNIRVTSGSGPRQWRIIAETLEKATEKKLYAESLIVAQLASYAKYALAMFGSDLTPARFRPAFYGGPVHFGQGIEPFFTIADKDTTESEFSEYVTFKRKASVNTLFTKDSQATVLFKEGYKDDYDLPLNPQKIFHGDPPDDPDAETPGVVQQVSPEFQHWTNMAGETELCFLLVPGWIQRYRCLPRDRPELDFDTRYDGPPLEEVLLSNSHDLVIYAGSLDVSVKGIYDHALTIATEGTIWIEGDIVNAIQGTRTQEHLGLIGGKIGIPAYVPSGKYPSTYATKNAEKFTAGPLQFMPTPLNHPKLTREFKKAVNFIAKGRQLADPTDSCASGAYYCTGNGPVYSDTQTHLEVDSLGHLVDCSNAGSCQLPSALDLDAVLFAVSGPLFMEGITNSDTGRPECKIPGADGHWYPYNDYYTPVGGPFTGRVVDPKYCRRAYDPIILPTTWDETAACDLRSELARPFNSRMWVYGSLLLAKYGTINMNDCGNGFSGFWSRTLIYNSRLRLHPPPAFPYVPQADVFIQWTKTYWKS